MEITEDLLPWILLAASWILFVGVIILRHKQAQHPEVDIWQTPVVTDLRAQLQEKDERYRKQMEFVVNFPEVIKTLTGALSVEEVTSAISRGMTTMLDPQRIGIFLAHTDKMLRLVDGTGFPETQRGKFKCSIGGSKLLPVLKYRSVSLIKDHSEAEKFLAPLNLMPEMGCPIWYGERLLGFVVISKPNTDQQMAFRVMAMLADMSAVSLHAAGLFAEIRKKAERDALTGLPNRRTLMTRVESEVERCRSYQSRFSLVMIDVDNFKNYNDVNGHTAGDKCLKLVASYLSKAMRKTDMAARYGGEEFTLVLQGADRRVGMRTADRIRKIISKADFPFKEKQPLGRVSVSMGLATFPDDAREVAQLFNAADAALYEAKEGGRDRVVGYERQSIEIAG